MRNKFGPNELVMMESGFLLKEIFADNYEYEEYFKLVNSVDLNNYFPSEFEVEFEEDGKSPRLKYPKDRSDVVILVLPIARKISSPKKRDELRRNAFQRYAGLIPKIRLEIKDELAMRKRLLAPEEEKRFIDDIVEQKRRHSLREIKKASKAYQNDKPLPEEGDR